MQIYYTLLRILQRNRTSKGVGGGARYVCVCVCVCVCVLRRKEKERLVFKESIKRFKELVPTVLGTGKSEIYRAAW